MGCVSAAPGSKLATNAVRFSELQAVRGSHEGAVKFVRIIPESRKRMTTIAPAVYRFASFTLDLDRLCLFGPDGQVELRPKSFDVLRYLLEHAGRVVGKEELIKAIWPHVTVTDESLTRCISEVRRGIGDDNQQIVKTVHRRGYILNVPISAGNVAAGHARQPVGGGDCLSKHTTTELLDQSTPGLSRSSNGTIRIGIVPKILQFDHFTLNLVRGCLQADGKDIELRPKTFEILCHLAENAGRLVPTQELREVVWPRVAVSDDSLIQCVRELRKKLGDRQHRLIKMVPRRGYILDTMLTPATSIGEGEANGGKQQLSFGTTGRPTIGVPPLTVIGDDPGHRRFAEGMTEGLIAALSRCNWLFIVQTSSSTQKCTDSDGAGAAREPRVDYVLRGTVIRAGSHLRIIVKLVDALFGLHIWAESFDGSIGEIFDVQDRIGERVVAAIESRLASAEFSRLNHRWIGDLSPHELVLCARVLESEYTKESMEGAFRCLKQARAVEPSYAPAMALEAFCRTFRQRQGWSPNPEEDTDEGYGLAIRAVEMGRHDPQVLSWSSIAIRSLGADAQRGWELATRSLELNPNSVQALVNAGYAELFVGNATKALKLLGRAKRLDPRDPNAWYTEAAAGQAYFAAGQYQEAVRWSKRALAQNPQFVPSMRTLAASLAKLGRVDEATRVVPLMLQQDPNLTVSKTHWQHRHMPNAILSSWLEGLRTAGLPE